MRTKGDSIQFNFTISTSPCAPVFLLCKCACIIQNPNRKIDKFVHR